MIIRSTDNQCAVVILYVPPAPYEAATDLEDTWTLGYRPPCRTDSRERCFKIKFCSLRERVCRCIPLKDYDGDETEFDDQVNDEMIETPEDQTEEFDETNQELEDPSKG
ncbi:hypothetical protein OS493_033630 [Desmophyllum pertusum]|uniref:Uncharacterized protein n=1 Tax=Desmophyllum pertusum TaxID=174260 RepID=A0A9X0CI84_9CNID|nr:hypothetical protein OS493_033630 [Desmophyllum pertusum]